LGAQVGVAPDATWFACANLVRNLGNPAKYLDCMQFMLAPYPLGGDPLADGDPAQAADVLNNSWGCPHDYEGCSAEVFAPALAALRRAGIFVVASAGNSGPRCGSVSDPIAIYDSALTVGAIDRDGNLAGFSSAGPVTVDGSGRIKPDIVAPGVDVLSTYPAGAYETASGTSMAGPHVVGVVALMWSANPALIGAIDQTEALLLEAAQPFTGTLAPLLTAEDQADLAAVFGEDNALQAWLAPDPQACLFAHDAESPPTNTAGYGVVDAYRAVELALEAGR
jgi:subtilisin family serine protease